MRYSTINKLKSLGVGFASGLIIITLILFAAGTTYNVIYMFHTNHVQGSESWSPGTLDDAKRVVTEIMTFETNEPGDIKLSSDTLRAWAIGPDENCGFDGSDIVYNKTYMLLSKKDFKEYARWLKQISKPYITYKKMLTPPLMPPPWEGLE